MSKIGDRIFFRQEFACPWWICFTFDNPVRALFQNPVTILSPYLRPGASVLDIGPGMGYFTVPMARMVGDDGTVVALDIQEKMLLNLQKRAAGKGVENIRTVLYDGTTFGLDGTFDFVLLFWMFHEVRGKGDFLARVRSVCKTDTKVLVVEPKVHVTKSGFEAEMNSFVAAGFTLSGAPKIGLSRSALFTV
jgi:ubiquinone/menaquinone biosynthesis C-methylase UbiE